MIERILAAVDDSPAGLAAALAAVDLAATAQASLRFVHVIAPGDGLNHSGRTSKQRAAAARDLLAYVSDIARQARVSCETELLEGDPGNEILKAARSWPAGLIVLGRCDTGGPGDPYVGSETRQVLEFCEQPVLVVPRRAPFNP